MKKRILAMLLTVCMVLTLTPAVFAANEAVFTDVAEDAWFATEVQWAYENELMEGTGNKLFEPDTNTTRGMIATILWRMEGEQKPAIQSRFTDVKAGTWYTDGILWANEQKIILGYGDGTCGPERDCTREELAVILYRYAAYKEYDVTAEADLSKYPDADKISDWAAEAMEWAVAKGLIQGMDTGLLAPDGYATRAQTAVILYRMNEKLVEKEPEQHTHSWDAGAVTKEPTCTEKGVKTYKCTCGETKTEDIAVTDTHVYGDYVANDDGTHTRVCSKNSAHTESENCSFVEGGNICECGYDRTAVAKIGDKYYSTLQAAVDAAVNGDTITLMTGSHTMPTTSCDVTIAGTKDTKIEFPYGNVSGNGNVITFDGITVIGETNSSWYSTLFNGAKKVVYKNCDIYNQLTTYCDSEFISCDFYNTFDNDYSVYCYSGSNIKFDGCSFDSKCSKAIKVYDEGNGGRSVYVNNCSFSTETADKKAAVEIDSTYSTYHIYFTGENVLKGKYTKLWNSDPGEDKGTNVYIDGVLQKAAATQDALNSAVSGSDTEVEVDLAAGSYTMPSTSGDVTISGTKETVISGNDCTAKNVVLNGVTIQSTGTAYTGIKHSEQVVYNDATIVGNMYLYAKEVVFNNCTFDLSTTNDYIWVYGATNVEFNNCTFNTMGKAILVFQDGSQVNQTVKVEGCTFNASAPAYNANHTIHISAVSIDGSQGGTYNVILNNNTVDSDFNGLWQDKTSAGNITVAVDGTTVLSPSA